MAKRLLALTVALAAIVGSFYFFVRPWYLRWGATDEELRRVLPSDAIVGDLTASQETRAITIHAGVDRVWPWLAQLGQDRGGFYSYDLLENLVGCRMPTEDRLRSEAQQWQLGDKLWMYPPDRAGGAGFATLRAFVPGRVMGFGTRMTGTSLSQPENGSWSFVLARIDDQTTRLIIRGRGTSGRSLLGVSFDRAIFEPAHFTMERRMMIGIKQLAEGGDRARLWNHVQVGLWTITFLLFFTGIVRVILNRHWLRSLAGLIASAAVFEVLTLGQPPVLVSVMLVALVVMIFLWPRRKIREESFAATAQIPMSVAGASRHARGVGVAQVLLERRPGELS